MKKLSLILLMLMPGIILRAQDRGTEEAILRLSGAAVMEELSESELERFGGYLSHPLRINLSPASVLFSAPILSQYQAASLADYRKRHGDILSAMELSLVDGFTREDVAALLPFISFESGHKPGERPREGLGLSGKLVSRLTLSDSYAFKLKGRFSAADRFSAGFTLQDNYFAAVSSRNAKWRAIVGDYRLRFGQGLLLWDGFILAGYSSPAAFVRRPDGASPALSFSPDGIRRGMALAYSGGPFSLTAFAARNAYGGNFSCFLKKGRLGVTGISGKKGGLSADLSYHSGMAGFSGETAFSEGKWKTAASVTLPHAGRFSSAATLRRTADRTEYAATGRYSSEKRTSLLGQSGFQSSVKTLEMSLSAAFTDRDGARRQFRLQSEAAWQISPLIKLKSRYVRTVRNYGEKEKDDFRTDIVLSDGKWTLSSRFNLVLTEGKGLLGYLEGGYKGERVSCFLRGTAYSTDGWAERIYMWERDAPESFSVPVCYGKGMRLALLASWKARIGRFRLRTYLKGVLHLPGKAAFKFTFCLEG